MTAEDFCSYEVAKLLKEKGFDEPVHYEYHYIISVPQFHKKSHNFNGSEYANCQSEWYSAPTHQMAMKWLREKFNINPVPYASSLGWAFDIFDLSNRDITGCKKLFSMDLPSKSECYDSYEEACEVAIKYCLENLI